MKTKIIIMCAGQAKRWEGLLPKHLALIGGVPNVFRTVDMLIAEGIDWQDIYLTVNQENFRHFHFESNPAIKVSRNFMMIAGSPDREIDRFRNGYPVMLKADRSIFLYGDTAYDRADLQLILAGNEYAFYGHMKGNPLTGKTYKEIFAVVVTDARDFKNEVDSVAKQFEEGKIWRETGWEVYANRQKDLRSLNKFIEVSKMTDDFDSLEEYEKVKALYEQPSEEKAV